MVHSITAEQLFIVSNKAHLCKTGICELWLELFKHRNNDTPKEVLTYVAQNVPVDQKDQVLFIQRLKIFRELKNYSSRELASAEHVGQVLNSLWSLVETAECYESSEQREKALKRGKDIKLQCEHFEKLCCVQRCVEEIHLIADLWSGFSKDIQSTYPEWRLAKGGMLSTKTSILIRMQESALDTCLLRLENVQKGLEIMSDEYIAMIRNYNWHPEARRKLLEFFFEGQDK